MTPLGIVSALPAEATALIGRRARAGEPERLLDIGADRLLVVAGVGPERARRASERLLARGARRLVSWGVAGGLDPALVAGDLLIPEHVLGRAGDCFAADPDWSEDLRRHLLPTPPAAASTLIESVRVVPDEAAKAALYRASGAVAVDMESAAVAAAARAADVPFVVLRAVCDPACTAIPRAALRATDELGRTRWGQLLSALAANPLELGGLLALRRAFRAALGSLRSAVEQTGPRLLVPEAR